MATREHSRLALLFATSGHSGVDRIVGKLIPALGRTPLVVDLLRIQRHGPYLEGLPANVRDQPLRCRHRNTVIGPLVGYLRRCMPAVLMTASHRLNRAALLARVLTGSPARVVIRMGMSPTATAQSLGKRAGRRLLRSMRRWYPRADAVIAPSAGVGADLVERAGVAPERLHVIPNPLVDGELRSAAAESLDDAWFEPGAPPVILGAGSLEPRKDFATLLRAFARVRQNREVRLVILGRGQERQALARLAEDLGVAEHVRLPGFEANPYRWMARACVFALTSRREGSGAVLVEAMACGTPVVSTDCPSGPAEILQDGRVGALAPVGDWAGLAAAIARTLDAPPAADVLAQAVTPFEVERSVGRYLHALGYGERVA